MTSPASVPATPGHVLSKGQLRVVTALGEIFARSKVEMCLTGKTALAAHVVGERGTFADLPRLGGPLDREPRRAQVQVSARSEAELEAVIAALYALELTRPEGIAQLDLPPKDVLQAFNASGQLSVDIATEEQYALPAGSFSAKKTSLQLIGPDHPDYPSVPPSQLVQVVQEFPPAIPREHAERIDARLKADVKRTVDAATDPTGGLLGWKTHTLGMPTSEADAVAATRRWLHSQGPKGGGPANPGPGSSKPNI